MDKTPKKMGSDGGIGAPYISQLDMSICKCCGRTQDLRMSICWDCATCESVIDSNEDMYDRPIPKLEGFSLSMSKLHYILKVYGLSKESEADNG